MQIRKGRQGRGRRRTVVTVGAAGQEWSRRERVRVSVVAGNARLVPVVKMLITVCVGLVTVGKTVLDPTPNLKWLAQLHARPFVEMWNDRLRY